MKIGILTLPLNTNYGGILQAYALQAVLRRMGHEVILLERKPDLPLPTGFKAKLVALITKCVFGEESLKLITWRQINSFVRENMQCRQEVDFENYISNSNFDAFVVGSDQVWRPFWKENYMPDYFLEFARNDNNVRKVAYAASFAVDEWEFTQEETERYASLIKLFDAVSVREASGVDLCKKYFNVDAVQMLDPTLLLESTDYEKLVIAKREPQNRGNMFCYILDQSDEKQRIIDSMSKQLSASTYEVRRKNSNRLFQLILCKKRYQFPAVTKWLRAFMDAEYVITDSFHGCVFSIIFNKPFWAIGNAGRGMARFTSLLKMFGLEARMLFENDDIDSIDFSKSIDWISVNKIKEQWQEKAFDYLNVNLPLNKA